MSVEIGQRAPDFELSATTGDSIALRDLRGQGPIVLLFVPLAFSPVCTNELTKIRDDYEDYTKLGAEVMATSVDSPLTLKVWAEQLKLPFPLLSDFNKEVSRAYGALHDNLLGLKGVAKRAVFVMDGKGTVRYRWVSDDPGQLPDFDEIKTAVKGAAAI